MVRKLAILLLVIGGLVPGMSFSLGLGNLQLHSYLNQPLSAEFELRGVPEEELDQLHVLLASPDEFERLGIEYMPILRQLRFQIVRKADGRTVVQVTTPRDFREPFLDFLVEVTWSKGRLLRHYTALVDPPVLVPRSAPVVQAPAAPARPPRAAVAAAPAPAPARAPRRVVPAQRTTAPRTYGPVRRSDTLWTIAQQVRPDRSLSIEQVMIALQRANPEAFIDNNINQLRAGAVLDVPVLNEIAAIDRREALAETRRQFRVWKENRQLARRKPAAAPEAAPAGGKLELLAVSGEEAKQLSGEAAAAGEGESKELQEALALAEEQVRVREQQNEELRSRIGQLEEQVENLERLASLKDEQLAALEKTLRELREARSEEVAPAAETEAMQPGESGVAEGEGVRVAAPAAEEVAQAETARPAEAMPAAEGSGNRYVVEGFEPVDVAQLPAAETPAAAEPVTPAPKPAPPPVAPQVADEGDVSLLDLLAENRMLVLAAGGVVLLILGLLVVRQRRKAQEGFEESILREKSPEEEAAAVEALASEQVSLDNLDSMPLSDFGASSIDILEKGEVGEADPLTEADVFIAYGRFEPAEAMIRQSIEQDPDRFDYRMKLLEIFFAAKNAADFEAYVKSLREEMPDQVEEAWERIAEMGRELSPSSMLFGEEHVAGLAQGESAGAEGADESLDFDMEELDLSGFEAEGAAETSEDAETLLSASEPEEESTSFTGEAGEESPIAAADITETLQLSPEDRPMEEIDETEEGASAMSDLGDLTAELEEMGLEDFEREVEEAAASMEATSLLEGAESLPSMEEEPTSFSEEPTAGAEEATAFSEEETALSEGEEETALGEESTLLDEGEPRPEVATEGEESEGDESTVIASAEPGEGDVTGSVEVSHAEADVTVELTRLEEPTEFSPSEDLDLSEEFTFSEELSLDELPDLEGEQEEGEAAQEGGDSEETRMLSMGDLDLEGLHPDAEASPGEDEEAFSFDLDEEEREFPADAETALFEAVDEVSTKLDLARAYMDMGDPEGARAILEEVLEEGDDDQKQDARMLLEKI